MLFTARSSAGVRVRSIAPGGPWRRNACRRGFARGPGRGKMGRPAPEEMPMSLTPEKLEEARRFLHARGGLSPCARCGHADFSLFDRVVAAPVMEEWGPGVEGAIRFGPAFPMLVVTCK